MKTDLKKIQKEIRARIQQQCNKSYLNHSNAKRKMTSNNKSN